MTSTININTIDASFPVAGQDNDSQGFRDNFENIKTALKTAATEITSLQDNSIAKGTDADNKPLINNLQGAALANFQSVNSYGTAFVATVPSAETAPIVVSYQNGSFQSVSIAGDRQLQIAYWPTNEPNNVYAVVRIEVHATVAGSVTFTNPAGSISTADNTCVVFALEANDKVIFDVWSTDGGNSVTVLELSNSRPRASSGAPNILSRFFALAMN